MLESARIVCSSSFLEILLLCQCLRLDLPYLIAEKRKEMRIYYQDQLLLATKIVNKKNSVAQVLVLDVLRK